jgi:hypothetical protein
MLSVLRDPALARDQLQPAEQALFLSSGNLPQGRDRGNAPPQLQRLRGRTYPVQTAIRDFAELDFRSRLVYK